MQRAAAGLGVAGWVENLPDGAVLCEGEADAAVLVQFEAKVRDGPRRARVDVVHVDELLPCGAADFVIR